MNNSTATTDPKSLSEISAEYTHMFYDPNRPSKTLDLTPVEDSFCGIIADGQKLKEKIELFFLRAFLGDEEPQEPPLYHILKRLKYAYIKEGDSRYITLVDNQTNIAYRMKDNSYMEGLLFPLQEIGGCEFERWCGNGFVNKKQ